MRNISRQALSIIFITCISFLNAQVQIGSDIDGESANDLSGWSVSLSSDGSTMAIGGTGSNSARIYKNESGVWTQIGSDIVGEATNDGFGISVSISTDGSVVAIGAYSNDGNGTNAGHVRIYKNISGTWTQIGSDIDGEAARDQSGIAVSLSSDGSTVAIGAHYNDGNGTNAGHVRVYKNISGTWTQLGSDIDGEAANDQSGVSVSLSSDGSIVAIGAWSNDGNGTNAGHVRIYKNISGTWTQIGSDIDGEAANDFSGSVSLSSDGSTVAIGAFNNNDSKGTNAGHVRVYENDNGVYNGVWTQLGSDIDGESAGDCYGGAVSLSSDGSTVAIGAQSNDGNGTNTGHVRIYKNISGTWTQLGYDIDGEAGGDESGAAVSLSSDGSTVAIGARLNDGNGTNAGHVRVYTVSTCIATSSTDTVTSCRAYIWTNGVTYTESSNTATDTFVNAEGCDSIVTLNLKVIRENGESLTLTECDSYTSSTGKIWITSGTYTDTLSNSVGCDSVITLNLTIVKTDDIISVNPANQTVMPGSNATYITQSIFDPNATYQWQRDNGTGFQNLSNAGQYGGTTSSTLIISNVTTSNDNEVYRCSVTFNTCTDTSEAAVLNIDRANVSEIDLNKAYAVYPNPTKGVVFIKAKASLLGAKYLVYSSNGAEVLSGSITTELTTLGIQDFAEGVYLISVGNDLKQTFRVIKE